MRRFVCFLLVAASLSCLPASAAKFTASDLRQLVTEISKALPQNSHFKYPVKCLLVEKSEPNAYSAYMLEGSSKRATMTVYTGLVKLLDGNKKLLRAVVAHELAHLSLGHSLDPGPSSSDLRALWWRQQEFAADKAGARALEKSGHSKFDMAEMLLYLDGRPTAPGEWLRRLTSDHPDAKARAAELVDNPSALNALMAYDTALAYEDARSHIYARALFELAGQEWPELTDAYANAAKCALMYYYDNLPSSVRDAWWRPDFGPLITNPHAPANRAPGITDEDRLAYRDSADAARKAIEKDSGNIDAQEMQALTQILEPDGKTDVIEQGTRWFEEHLSAASGEAKLRYANNAAVGYARREQDAKAFQTILSAQTGSDVYNPALAENLGLSTPSDHASTHTIDVLFTWLCNTPQVANPHWATIQKNFAQICANVGFVAKPIKSLPMAYCMVTDLVTSDKDLAVLVPTDVYKSLLGSAGKVTTFSSKYPDLTQIEWHQGKIAALTERGIAMRLTSYEPGAYLMLKPIEPSSHDAYQIKVGDSDSTLFALIDPKLGVKKQLAKGPTVETWTYFPNLGVGVLLKSGAVAGITVSPVMFGKD